MIKVYKSKDTKINFFLRNKFDDFLWNNLSKFIEQLYSKKHKDADILFLMLPAIILDAQRILIKNNSIIDFNNSKLTRVMKEPYSKNYFLKKFLIRFFRFFSKNKSAFSFDLDSQKISYAELKNKNVKLIRHYEYFLNPKKIKCNEHLDSYSLGFIEKIITLSGKEFNIRIDNENILKFVDLIKISSSYYISQLKHLNKIRLPLVFWSGTLLSPFNRIFALSVLQNK